jgi:hypothetical protein
MQPRTHLVPCTAWVAARPLPQEQLQTLRKEPVVPGSIQKALSIFLGGLMFMFGFLKFFNPISGWFEVQILQSHLPHAAIPIGKLAEMTTGSLFLLPRLSSWGKRLEYQMVVAACLSLSAEMLIAFYVHLQPGVPPGVLPLGIKAPVLPLFVLALGVVTAVATWRKRQSAYLDHPSNG